MSEETKKELENEDFEEVFEEEENLPVETPAVKQNFLAKTKAKIQANKIAKLQRKATIADLKLAVAENPADAELKAQLKAVKTAEAVATIKKVGIGAGIVAGVVVATAMAAGKKTNPEETADDEAIDVPVEEVAEESEEE